MTSNPATVSNGLDARVEKLEIWVAHQDRIIEELNRASDAFAERRMDRAVSGALSGRRLDEVARK